MQSSNGHHSMHQEVPMVFLLVLFVCPSTALTKLSVGFREHKLC